MLGRGMSVQSRHFGDPGSDRPSVPRVPIVLTSRADALTTRIASAALAKLLMAPNPLTGASGTMSADVLLTLNAGSSTVKVALFEAAPSGARLLAEGTDRLPLGSTELPPDAGR